MRPIKAADKSLTHIKGHPEIGNKRIKKYITHKWK